MLFLVYIFRCRQGELFDYLTQVVTLSEKRTRYANSLMLTCPCNVDPPHTPLLYSKTGVFRVYIHYYAPNFEKVGDILVSACPYVCVCVCVCVYSCSRYHLETSCMDSSCKNSRSVFLVFPQLSPLVKLRPFDKQGDEIL